MPRYSIEGDDGLRYSIEGPEGATEAQVWAAIQYEHANQPPAPLPHREVDDGFLDVLGYGAESALSRAGSTIDTLLGDLEGVEQGAVDAQRIPQTRGQQEFRADLNANPEGSFTEEASNLFNAIVDNPGGAWDEVVAQLPNAVPTLGGMAAGGAAGLSVGGPIGAVVGAGIGMFLGTGAIETGAMAQAKAGDGFTEQDRKDALVEGGAKSAVITAFDLATLGVNKFLGGVPGKAAHAAVSKFLVGNGVDISSEAAIRVALANKAILSGATDIAQKTVRTAAQTPAILAGLAAESAGEGAGEYFGEMAAGHDPSIREAMLEGALSLPQSVAETAIGRSLNKKNEAIEQISGKTPGQFKAEQVAGVTPSPIAGGIASTTQAQAAGFNAPTTPFAAPRAPVEPVTDQTAPENPYGPSAVEVLLADTAEKNAKKAAEAETA